jgi:hypothetical protein
MAYNPLTDFLALIRSTSGGARSEQVPGLDYIIAALARANFFALAVSQTAPVANQAATVWLKPSSPSWVAEASVYLWNTATNEYEPATSALWYAVLSQSTASVFQAVTGAAATIQTNTGLLAITRANPLTTALSLPPLALRAGREVKIVDFSTAIAVEHDITLTPAASDVGATIMQQNSWKLISTAVQLAGIRLYPSTDLNAWVIAP